LLQNQLDGKADIGTSSNSTNTSDNSDSISVLVNNPMPPDVSRKQLYEILPTIEITQYAQGILDAISVSKLAIACISVVLYQAGFRLSFNLVLNHDAGFSKTTVRHL
jgi:hypothetical protein